jgi:hypothetical protein
VSSTPPLGLGFVGAGRFAAFVASVATGPLAVPGIGPSGRERVAVTLARDAALVNAAVRVPTAGTRAPHYGRIHPLSLREAP